MLTKSLVRFKVYRGKVKPSFIDASNEALLFLAEQLIAIFKAVKGCTREALEDETNQLVTAFSGEAMIARGMVKLLFDRSEFEAFDDEAQPLFRANLFEQGGSLLRERLFTTPEDYFKELEQALGASLDDLRSRIFADLIAHQPIIRFRSLTPAELIHSYNTSLVQWLLLHSQRLEITLSQTTPTHLRQLLKYLRFHQLLADIQIPEKHSCRLLVDGPMSLFAKTRKYGMSLARFFPALLHQNHWRLVATVEPKRKECQLVLDDSCGIKPISGHFLAYVPEVVLQFSKGFEDKVKDWRIEKLAEFIPLPGELFCFPDFRLSHVKGIHVSLELFHAWHQSHLTTRLQQLATCTQPPLLLGVDRKLARNSSHGPALEASPYFQKWGFVFTDMPAARQLLPLLNALLEERDRD